MVGFRPSVALAGTVLLSDHGRNGREVTI